MRIMNLARELGHMTLNTSVEALEVGRAVMNDSMTMGMLLDLEDNIHRLEIMRSQLVLATSEATHDVGRDAAETVVRLCTENLNKVNAFVASIYEGIAAENPSVN